MRARWAFRLAIAVFSWLIPALAAAQAPAAIEELLPPVVEQAPRPAASPFRLPDQLAATLALSRQAAASPPGTTPRKCRPGRRAWIGALIGAGASIPLAKLAHDRWENEAANGAGAAATTVLLSAGVGALVGLSTCR
jgi:hypothetical protein